MKSTTSSNSNNPRRSSCGAPIPSFRAELDQLERELLEDDDEHQQWRQRKERRRQSKELKRARLSSTTKPIEAIVRRSADHGSGASDDDDDDDLLGFDYRRKNPLPAAATKAKDTSDGSDPVDGKENDDEANQCHGDPLNVDGLASEPLADSTNSQSEKDVPEARVDGDLKTKQVSNPELLQVVRNEEPSTALLVAPSNPVGEATLTLSEAVVEIFERSDVRTCTCKQVWKQLEQRHGFTLDSATKRLVRSQLTELTQQYLATMKCPTTVAPLDVKDSKETVSSGKCGAGASQQKTGESPVETVAPEAIRETGMQNERLGSGTLPMPEDSKAQGDAPAPAPAEPRHLEAQSSSSSRGKRRKAPEVKSEPTSAGRPGTAVDGSLPAPPPPTKRRGRPPKAPMASANPSTVQEGQPRGLKRVFPDVPEPTTAVPSVPAKTARRKNQPQCALCKSCPCRHPAASTTASSVLSLVQSDSAVEKALMRRLLKLEETADRYDEQAEAVRRKLKKHRREMWRKLDPQEEKPMKGTEYRFLPDAEDMDRDSAALTGSNPLGESTVRTAKCALFSFAPTYQPTLTQMFGCNPSKNDEGCDGIDVDEPPPVLEEGASGQVEEDAETEGTATDEEDADSFLPACGNDVVLEFDRVETRNGVGMTEEASRIWSAYSTVGGHNALWDRIFDNPNEAEGLTLEQLETMFDDVPHPESGEREDNSSRVRLSMLTQRGQLLADEIQSRVDVSPGRVSRLQLACPQWQENILFALQQESAPEVQKALAGVLETQSKLRRSKEAMMRAIEAQEDVLNVFAEALTASLTRFDTADGPMHCPSSASSHLKRMSKSSIEGDDAGATETKTLSVSSSSPFSSQDDQL